MIKYLHRLVSRHNTPQIIKRDTNKHFKRYKQLIMMTQEYLPYLKLVFFFAVGFFFCSWFFLQLVFFAVGSFFAVG